MYSSENFKTKKAFKEAVANGNEITIYKPGPFGKGIEEQGQFCVEGPHYPMPHKWYATVTVKDYKVVTVK